MENGPVGKRGGEVLTLGLELCRVPPFRPIRLPLRGWCVCRAAWEGSLHRGRAGAWVCEVLEQVLLIVCAAELAVSRK